MRPSPLVIVALLVPLSAGGAPAAAATPPAPAGALPAAVPPADDAAAPGDKPRNQKGEPVDKLTPVRPMPPQRRLPAYQLYLEVDAPIFTIAAVFAIGRQIRGGLAPAYCAPVPNTMTEQSDHCDA